MGRACSTNVDKKNAYRILVGKPERKRPLGRRRCTGRMISEWTLEREDVVVWIGLI
jgi:hypothetical protein